MDTGVNTEMRKLIDKSLIGEAMARYIRGIDRRDLELVGSAFHEDAFNDHGDYKGPATGFVNWVRKRHASIENSMHLTSNCYCEFFGNDVALVETYFLSRRAVVPPNGAETGKAQQFNFVESMGRYVDRFERRHGDWKIAHRIVVFDAKFTSVVSLEPRTEPNTWASRDAEDAVIRSRAALVQQFGEPE